MVRQHVALVALATLLATAIGVPLGILAARRPRLGRPLGALASLVQTVPSLALFGFLLPLPFVGGVGASTALVALVLYGVLPVFRTTVSGLAGIDRALIDTATAMGLTDRDRLLRIELPLALPSIVSGVRIATVVGVGTATIAAAVGAGGLGEYIFRGLSMVDPIVILAGAIPAAGLALAADGLLALVERSVRRQRRLSLPRLAAIALVPVAGSLLAIPAADGRSTVVVGSKNFTEQIILGELIAQAIERTSDLAVTRKLNLGGTLICEQALRSGAIDLYVEYSGTALTAIFGQPVVHDRQRALEIVRERYTASQRDVGPPLGFNNTFAMLVRGEVARKRGLRTLTEAMPHARTWRAAFGYEFLERADGFAGLAKRYGLVLAEPPRAMDLSLTYRALAAGEVDLIAGDATAGLIPALDLSVLEDDLGYFPPYDAIPVVRTQTLGRHPSLRRALDLLAGRIDESTMRRMNAAVDVDKRSPSEVVAEALARWVDKTE
jgi:osmoprotectant transport system permease protein